LLPAVHISAAQQNRYVKFKVTQWFSRRYMCVCVLSLHTSTMQYSWAVLDCSVFIPGLILLRWIN
jgi:hypothetical protein